MSNPVRPASRPDPVGYRPPIHRGPIKPAPGVDPARQAREDRRRREALRLRYPAARTREQVASNNRILGIMPSAPAAAKPAVSARAPSPNPFKGPR